ncbi:hypothetical protein [Paucisalibacillus sp. EB02]|uniref:hypothetical protein n=1 Tax=Paucisalibacillus sp. EB02 TaxID=1347087 RepID=UPI0005A9EF5A|nr:hypothetical protein [Paucisalibacillus sp. EB02]
MILRNGVSGFNRPNDLSVDGVFFKKICYSIINNHGGKIISFNEPEIACNYYQVKIAIFGDDLYILLNSTYPFLAFASSVEDISAIQFVIHDKLSTEFTPYYNILLPDELNEVLVINEHRGRIAIENENELNDAELYNVKHWKPRRVGDVVFNFWD